MRRRALQRRYGRAKGHLPLSRLSLSDYERELGHALHYLGQRASLVNEDERMMRLRGWENGVKPITLALKIERTRKTRRGGR
jgi:hypothetical protein